jgi:hypothetical protein
VHDLPAVRGDPDRLPVVVCEVEVDGAVVLGEPKVNFVFVRPEERHSFEHAEGVLERL